MKNLYSTFLVLIVLFTSSCASKEDKANKLIKQYMFENLHDFSSYEPISTEVDSAFSSILDDSTIVSYANKILKLEYKQEEIMESLHRNAIERKEYHNYTDIVQLFENQANQLLLTYDSLNNEIYSIEYLMTPLIDSFNSKFIGFQVTHNFRSKAPIGNYVLTEVIFLMDTNFSSINEMSSKNLSDLDLIINRVQNKTKSQFFRIINRSTSTNKQIFNNNGLENN